MIFLLKIFLCGWEFPTLRPLCDLAFDDLELVEGKRRQREVPLGAA